MRLLVSRLRFASLNSVTSRRRTGQALLLAVLIMIFVALVGATFITVVALNMDATATQEERQKAASAANAGMEVVNYQINSNGTDWRPEKIAPPPAPGDPEYSYYWTAQDIARGYARTTQHTTADLDGDGQAWSGATWPTGADYEDDWLALENAKAGGSRAFVKFPDPRLEQNTGSHTYMAEVAVADADAGDSTDTVGMLKITVVGQSSDDPNVFVKRIAYKGTSEKNGAFAWDQFFTNWNYTDKKNIATAITVDAGAIGPPITTTNTLVVSNANGLMPGRSITIQDVTNPSRVENALILSVNANTITLRQNLSTYYLAGASVRGATPLANGLIGFEGTTATPTEAQQFDSDGVTPAVSGPPTWEQTNAQFHGINYGILSNGDVQLIGKANYNLNATAKFTVAGTILRSPNAGANRTVRARFNDGTDIPTSYGAVTVGSGTATGQQLQVQDNPNPSQAQDPTQTSRNVQPTTPPDMTNFPRYLENTKYTPGGMEGLGDGVYINNSGDREKVVEGSNSRELDVTDVQRLVQGKSFPSPVGQGNANYTGTTNVVGGNQLHRLSFPRVGSPVTDTYVYPALTGSLEQRGIRGWVNTYEFVPRGAKIEVQTTPTKQIVITLDDRSEAGMNLPDASKAWPHAALTLSMPKCYRMVINTDTASANYGQRSFGAPGFEVAQAGTVKPFNGVIYAEGNVRVRGVLGDENLTIVSMNNIYIEGNLVQSGTGRFALLARKNVILNPTQFITHVAGSQDRDVATQQISGLNATNNEQGANDGSRLAVSTLGTFRVGDYIRVGTTDTTWRQVVRKAPLNSPTPSGLVLKPPFTLPLPFTAPAPIQIKSVAAVIMAATSGNTIDVSSAAPFRIGDLIRVGTNNWVTVTGIIPGVSPTFDRLTLSATLPAAVGDSVQILSDPDFVPGANVAALAAIRTANGWPTWPNEYVPPGSTTGDYFVSPEWFYRLTGPRDVLARDMRFDNFNPGGPVGSGYQLSTRMIGERKLAYKLRMVTAPAAANGQQRVRMSENNNVANTTVDPAELWFTATSQNPGGGTGNGPGNNGNGNGNGNGGNNGNNGNGNTTGDWTFNYDLRGFQPPVGANSDTTQTMDALLNKFNLDQRNNLPLNQFQQKWRLDLDPTATATAFNMIQSEAQSIPARYFLPLGLTAGNTDDWVANTTNPKRLYLSTAARQLIGNTLDFIAPSAVYKLGAADSPTGNGDLATSNTDETANNANNFYWYAFTSPSSGVTYERQEWLRWSSRPLTGISNTNNIVAVTTDSAINALTGSTAPLRVAPFKLERSGFDAAENPYNPVTYTVQATIFAQEGSWCVVPMPLQHRNDVNNSGGITVAEVSYATRMRRANYKINFTGRIVQNFAPSVLTDYNDEPSSSDTTMGLAGQWADSLSYPTDVYQHSATAGYRGQTWETINYLPDPTQIPVIPPTNGPALVLPPSPDLSYAS